MTIRSERLEDVAAIFAVNAAAFQTDAESLLVDALRRENHLSVSLVAEIDGRVVGHVACSGVTTEPAIPLRGAGLAPLAVLPAHQRSGIGKQLVTAAIDECTRRQFDYLVVLGDTAYYARFGFEKASVLGLGNEYGADEHFMVLQLNPSCLRGQPPCLVRYAPPFAAF